ncbi:MAG TPA: hypothetical protein VHU14_00460 [Solirubrobacterales bacterium]|jgi:hypothetical protein|nr:hypothetical protein [Solirubrobacterales bacterium]
MARSAVPAVPVPPMAMVSGFSPGFRVAGPFAFFARFFRFLGFAFFARFFDFFAFFRFGFLCERFAWLQGRRRCRGGREGRLDRGDARQEQKSEDQAEQLHHRGIDRSSASLERQREVCGFPQVDSGPCSQAHHRSWMASVTATSR